MKMMSDKDSYIIRAKLAAENNDMETADKEINAGLDEIGEKIKDLLDHFHPADHSLIIASMHIIADAMYSTADDKSKKLAEAIREELGCVAIDIDG